MAFIDNMEMLRTFFPKVEQKILEIEEKLDKGLIRTVSSKEGNVTFKVRKQFMHDNREPLQEARRLIQQFQNVQEHSDILFYGIGMGYHINAFVEQYPDTPFSIYEPVPEVFYQFMCHADLKQIPLHLVRDIYIETRPEDPNDFCNSYVKSIRSSALVIDLPAYHSIFPAKHKAFFTEFENQINERRNSLTTVSAFQKRWTINSIKNFIQVLNSPDILLEKKGYFKNKPAILVASGPSLEEEIKNLQTIVNKGLAYVFSVGTAINTLIQHEVYPHAACTYDPTEENQIVCKEVLEKGIKTIPLIFGSTVGYETLEKYPGPKMHMLISQDSLAAYYLKPDHQERVESINDATTIAVITLQLLAKLDFNPIVLVGQNLAYLDSKHYAAGSTFHPIEAGEQELTNAILVKDVYGNEVASSHTFVRMRQQFEIYLSHFKDRDVINTTRYGAHIEGTRFQSLEEVMKSQLHDRVVEDSWLESGDCSYDMEYLIKQSHIMNHAYENVNQLFEKCKIDLKNISDLTDCGDYIRIAQSYDQFNISMDKLRNNQFFTTIITPMNRVELELLMLAVPAISAERDPILKAQIMEKEFRSYLSKCEQDINSINSLFQEMSQSIQCLYMTYAIRKKSSQTKILLIDCDGILTDGAIYYSASGDELRKFDFKDRTGIIRLQERGIQTLLINLEGNAVIENAARKLGINTKYSEYKERIIASVLSEYALDYTEIACIFNDMTDLELFKQAGLSFAVGNASQALQNEVDYVLTVNGGEGAIMEIAELLTGNNNLI
jgi:YrbI family 3-deoxy-D-manno-octulosonate 8-phosphate phosphatase